MSVGLFPRRGALVDQLQVEWSANMRSLTANTHKFTIISVHYHTSQPTTVAYTGHFYDK